MAEDTQRLYEEGNQARVSGDYDTARSLLTQALAASPEDPQCLWAMGHVQLNCGEFDECVETFQKVTDLQPQNAKYALDLAKSYEMLGMFEEAKPWLERVIEIDGSSPEAEEARKSLSYY